MLLELADALVYDILGFAPETRLGASVSFFIYDSVKILLLLFVLIFLIGVIRTYLPQDKIRQWMGKRGLLGNLYAALFGAVTPFCSCSSIPLFLGFLEAGIPLGVTFSFLIASPLINEYLVILMLGYFGWKVTVLYVASGMAIGILSGAVLGRMNLERYLVSDLIKKRETQNGTSETYPAFTSRLHFGWNESVSITGKIWLWVLAGVAVGAVIHNYVPEEAIQRIISRTGVFSVPIAAVLGVPMYGSCAAIVPIAVVLFQKGIPLGAALAFMMAVAALSLPEAIMLRRAMKLELIAIFFGITAGAIVLTGYVFNFAETVLH